VQLSPFDNLPPLSKEEAIEILEKPPHELNLSSDYYKAVFHLSKYPGLKTEQLLLNLIVNKSNETSIAIARRKAVESLARLKCYRAIPAIGKCLSSSDEYLVEISAWALKELDCNDQKLIKRMVILLDDPKQNRRVLCQSLGALGGISELTRLKACLENGQVSLIERGSLIAAIFKLSGGKIDVSEIRSNLLDENQNSRHCAVQDAIDSGDIGLLPSVLKTPVAPFFRFRAINSLWPENVQEIKTMNLVSIIDSTLDDHPDKLTLLPRKYQEDDIEVLVEQLFNTDFNHCYLAQKVLFSCSADEIWPCVSYNIYRAKKDYGALYFFVNLFRNVDGWGEQACKEIREILLFCLSNKWPANMKFRPSAILAMKKFDPNYCWDNIFDWLNANYTTFWASRYAALIVLESIKDREYFLEAIGGNKSLINDKNRFVRAKAAKIFECKI